jgi:hypothetical protein
LKTIQGHALIVGDRGWKTDMSSAGDARDEALPKLPLWDTIGLSYANYFHNFRDVLLICWLWLIVVAPLWAIVSGVQWSWMAKVIADLKQGVSPPRPIHLVLPVELRALIWGVSLVFMLAGTSIAVAWHRRIILGEQPRLSGSNVASGSFWRYLGIGIVIVLIALVPVLVGFLVFFVFVSPFASHGASGSLNRGLALLIFLVMFCLYLTGIAIILRLCLLLPARAVGDLGTTFKQVWNRTRGNTWRLFWGILACVLPPGLIIEVISLILFGFPNPAKLAGDSLPVAFVAISSILMVCYLLTLPIWIGFLSLSYLHFCGRRPD